MALDKTGLKNNIEALLTTLKDYDGTGDETQAKAIEKFANDLANAIDTYVKTATVATTVATVVIGTLPAGPVAASGSGSGTGNLS